MLLTITPVVLAYNRKQDGGYNLKIRITWKGRSRYLATNIVCTKADLTRSLKIKNPAIEDAAAVLIRELRDSVADLSPALMDSLTVEEIANIMRSKRSEASFHLDFFEFGNRFTSRKKPTTRRAYTMALGALERFIGKRALDVNGITKAMLLDFIEEVDAAPKMHFDHHSRQWKESERTKQPHGQSSRHIAKLAAIYNAARDEYNDEDSGLVLIPRNPFRGLKVTAPMVMSPQSSLGVEVIQRILDARTDDPSIRVALDAFIVSFCLMGANLADLYAARPFEGDVWVYNRLKTSGRRADRAEMRVMIPPQVCRYIAHLQGNRRWWLGKLHDINPSADQITSRINRALKRWTVSEGLEPFTFYAARHSWATIARNNAGVDKATVDECLCHVGSFRLADIYLEKDWSLINKANTKVLALFDFHDSGSSSCGSAQ